MSDPIADLLIRLKNALSAGKTEAVLPYSKHKKAVLDVILKEGFISAVSEKIVKNQKMLLVTFGAGKMMHLKRLSKPGQRIYVKANDIPKPLRGLGLIVMSTPVGVISGREAKKTNIGGELICEIW
ncbi:MAG: 30S ribosomal protein S8 [Patescibacteria group bacterium]|jgi:small subunit ribosomal protein S8